MKKEWIYFEEFGAQHPFNVGRLREEVRRAFDFKPLKFDDRRFFALKSDFTDWVLDGRKCTTIRFKRNCIDFPALQIMGVVRTNHFERRRDLSNSELAFMIKSFGIKRFENLTEDDARRDGFNSRDEAIMVLREIYPNISNTSLVSIYGIEVC